jgi:next to BRCA1 gene 1 protein
VVEKAAQTEGKALATEPTPASSTSSFKLPPLALDTTSDLFREFWPRVAQEIMSLVQESSNAQPTDSDVQSKPTASQLTPADLTNILIGKQHDAKPEESPLFNEPLLQRPSSEAQSEPEMSQINLAPLKNSRSLAALLGYKSPSPVPTSALATSVSSLEEKDATTSEPNQLSASFISDTTVPDGQVFPPGAEFVKSWHMLNNGERPWPDTTELVFVAGERLVRGGILPQKITVGELPCGQEVDVWTGELKVINNCNMCETEFINFFRPRMRLVDMSVIGD